MCVDNWLPSSWDNILVPCSGVKQSKKNVRNRWMCEYICREQCERWLVVIENKGMN